MTQIEPAMAFGADAPHWPTNRSGQTAIAVVALFIQFEADPDERGRLGEQRQLAGSRRGVDRRTLTGEYLQTDAAPG